MPHYMVRQSKSRGYRWLWSLGLLVLLAPLCSGAEVRRRISVGTSVNYPPYEYRHDGKPCGYSVDMLRAAAAAVQLDVEFRPGVWHDIRQDLEQGRLDALSGMYATIERDQYVDFTAPFAMVRYALFVRRGGPIKSFADLAGREVAVQQGDVMHDYLLASGYRVTAQAVADPAQALQRLAAGRYDAAIMPDLQGAYLIDLYGAHGLKRHAAAVPVQKYCFAVREGDDQLRLLLDEGLRLIKADGTAAAIHDKWFRVYEQRSIWQWLRLVAVAVLLILSLLAVSLFWSWSLRRQVRRKTSELRQELEQRRLVEAALLQSESNYGEIFNAAGDAIFVQHASSGVILDANRKVQDLFGFSAAEFRQLGLEQTCEGVSPYTAADAKGWIQRAASGEPQLFEWRVRRKDRSLLWVEVSLRRASIGGDDCLLAVIRDIAKRKEAETSLHRLATAIEQTVDIIMVTDLSGVIVYVNPAFTRVTGYERGEVEGKSSRLLKSAKHDRSFYTELWGTIAAGNTWNGCLINRKKNGELYHEECSISPVRDESGRIINYVAVKRDITMQKALEAQLRQAQKMEVIGQLASGIAHDFNNLLLPILGYSDLNMLDLAEDNPLYADLMEIRDAAQRAQTLTRQLLAFSRKQSMEVAPVLLNDVVQDFSKFLRRLLRENIQLHIELEPDLFHVQADRIQMEQILMNLVVNARDAMPDGGTITVATSSIEIAPETAARHNGLHPGPHVMLRVADTGHGMSDQVKAKVFEPFFTTKPSGSGTGLGLSTTSSIVQEHHGYIQVDSQVGVGTVFTIYLPKLATAAVQQQVVVPEPVAPGGGQTVLITEDEESIRKLICRMLETQGYRLLECPTPEDALRLAQQQPGIDLLLTDVIMPGMSGLTLYERLRQTHGDMKVLYISGYTGNALAPHGVLDPEVNFLQKPFSVPSLLKKISETLTQ